MDLLSNLNLDVLPEQQTRINPNVSIALQNNPNINLGFDACCTCAKLLTNNSKEDVCCKGCKRVWYCSKECRRLDSEISSNTSTNFGEENEEEQMGGGHSAIICALLRLCSLDEDVENLKNTTDADNKLTKEERESAIIRIISEFESYPATLANVIMDAPCFEPILDKFKKHKKQRRGKKDRQIHLDVQHQQHQQQSNNNETLTIHIIGASKESELWGDFQLKHPSGNAFGAYSEALSNLTSTHKGLKSIRLAFIGPNCPIENMNIVKYINDDDDDNYNKKSRLSSSSSSCKLILETHCHNYEAKYLQQNEGGNGKHSSTSSSSSPLSKPDIVVFFNPGFTCPDYDWSDALKACQNRDKAIKTPFLVTTNTEMEAIADMQYLHSHGYIDSLPASVADIVNEGMPIMSDNHNHHHEDNNNTIEYNQQNTMFFGENVYAGSRVRQSGNMANDLYCKNKYIFGGLFSHGGTGSSISIGSHNITEHSKKKREAGNSSVAVEEPKLKKKKHISASDANRKKSNAALM